MVISNNNIDNNLINNNGKSLERISSGNKINSASDNASGLAISTKLLSEANGISLRLQNTNNRIGMSNISDKSLENQSNILDGIKENLLKSSNDTTSQEGRTNILNDIKKQLENLNNIAEQTNYNGQLLLQNDKNDTTSSENLQFQTGKENGDIINSGNIQSNTEGLNLNNLLNQNPNTFNSDTARSYLNNIDNAIDTVNSYRGDIGSTINQLESNRKNLLTQYTNTKRANSTISDVDYAKEMTNFSKQNILSQVGSLIQSQSNVNQQQVLKLLT